MSAVFNIMFTQTFARVSMFSARYFQQGNRIFDSQLTGSFIKSAGVFEQVLKNVNK